MPTAVPENFKHLVEIASADVLALSRRADGSAVHSMESVIEETLEAIAERQTNPETGVQTGFDGLDNRLMSLRKGGCTSSRRGRAWARPPLL